MGGQAKARLYKKHIVKTYKKPKKSKTCEVVVFCLLGEINCKVEYNKYTLDCGLITNVYCEDDCEINFSRQGGRIINIMREPVYINFHGIKCIGYVRQIATNGKRYIIKNIDNYEMISSYVSNIKCCILQSINFRNIEARVRESSSGGELLLDGTSGNGTEEGIIGFLFPCYESKDTTNRIIPYINEIDNIIEDTFLLVLVGIEDNQYNLDRFKEFREYLEMFSEWKWSRQTELLIMRYEVLPDERVYFDFGKTFDFKIDDLLKNETFKFFSEIIGFITDCVRESNSVDDIFSKLDIKASKMLGRKTIDSLIKDKTGFTTEEAFSMKNNNYLRS